MGFPGGGLGKGACIPGTGKWTCSNCGKTDCLSTRYTCYRCGVPRYFDGCGMEQGNFGDGQGNGGMVRTGVPSFQGQGGVGAGMSGTRLVGALGRDQTYVPTVNRTQRKGNGGCGSVREGPVPGAGVGGSRVRFEEMPENVDGVGVGEGGKGGFGRSGEMVLEAVEALKTLLGRGVGTLDTGTHSSKILPPKIPD